MTWTEVYYISEWVVRVGMAPVVSTRRSPNAAMAWLLVIFFLPWAGLLLYWLIGENRLPGRRIALHERLLNELGSLAKRFENHPNVVHPELGPQLDPTVKLAERLGSMPILGGNDVELMTKTRVFVDRLVQDIAFAQRHVHLVFYIFAEDETGQRVADALLKAAARGVKCRVLLDAVGSRRTLKGLGRRLRKGGVELHPALPVNLFRRRAARIDLRNHRKLAVIDGRVAYAGSQNIVDPDYGHRKMAWHDMMARLTGPIVLELQAVFYADWYFETDELLDLDDVFLDPERTGDIPAQTLPSGPSYPVENYQRLVVSALHAAQTRVTITTPYFVPDEALFQALQVAVMRGVEVELIVPRKYDQRLVGAASRAYYDDMLTAGVRIYLYGEGLLHSKTIAVDDKLSLVGSSNFDMRSFALNFELNMLLYGADVNRRLRAEQQRYLDRSMLLTTENWSRRGYVRRALQTLARLMSPLL